MSDEKDTSLDRRSALKLIATTAAAVPVLGCSSGEIAGDPPVDAPVETSAKTRRSPADPDLLNPTIGWDFLLREDELKTLSALCDVIIPRDHISPGAGALGAQDYINEWVSAPYEGNRKDLVLVRGGVVWLNGESHRRFGQAFTVLGQTQKHAICDDIKWQRTAKPPFRAGARFFAKVRDLAATAFYTTDEGMADIGYIGNQPLATFDGPPVEIMKKLGLE